MGGETTGSGGGNNYTGVSVHEHHWLARSLSLSLARGRAQVEKCGHGVAVVHELNRQITASFTVDESPKFGR